MEVSEEQKRRMEANRAAALARRNAKSQNRSLAPQSDVNSSDCRGDDKQLSVLKPCTNIMNHALSIPSASVNDLSDGNVFKCNGGRKLLDGPDNQQLLQGCGSAGQITGNRVIVALEMCAPDRFFAMVRSGFFDRGFLESVFNAAKCENLDPSAMWPVYYLKDYDKVTEALKSLHDVEYERIPWSTRGVLEKFQRATESGVPVRPNHITDSEVEELLLNLPPRLSKTLLPFQKDGVKFGLKRGGRCLIADEMGVGKTIQAIAIASCYREEGSLLVICPASLRNVWADELERWLLYLSPLDVHLVFGQKNDLAENMELPRVVVISYHMLTRLRESILSRKWGMVIVDEAHNLRCTRKKVECDETMAVLDLVKDVKRVVLLTGTPSLSRPFDIFNQINCLWPNLLGKNKYEFARNYCDRPFQSSGLGNSKDFSRGSRLLELNVLLRQAVMIRRLKNDVLQQLPPKRRQVICLQLAPVDIKGAKAFTAATMNARISARLGEQACKCGFTRKGVCGCEEENEDESNDECENREKLPASGTSAKYLTGHEIGIAKLRGFQEWLLNNSIFASGESPGETCQEKMIIFAHHLEVLNSVQTFVHSKGIEYIRIDGSTPAQDRLKEVSRFQLHPEVKLAIVGVTAAGVGLDFSAAQRVVFVELPKSASEMLQAEDRAHRRGQKNAVNIYIFAAKGTADDKHWQTLSRSLERMSTMTDGAQTSLEIESVVDAENACRRTDTSLLSESNRSLGMDICDQLSEDSCITTESDGIDTNSISQRLISSQFEDTTGGPGEASVGFPARSLMFEVSSNTGRVHLFLRSSDEYTRPTSLQANFKPEDLAHFADVGICERGALPNCLAQSAAHREVATLFWEEYSSLRPVLQKRLRGRPLSLPVWAELESFDDSDQYIAGGILKAGSRRRWTPKDELGRKIPAGATWRLISYHKGNGLRETKIEQAWNVEGVPLCKYCQQPCKGKRSMRPAWFRDLFCQSTCFEEFNNKTNRRYIRQELFELERGVCVKCSLDCHALVVRIRPLPSELRRVYILDKAPHFTEHKQMLEKLIKDPIEGNAWHADHIVAVADGGGECRLENFQTLCIACHAKVTAEQHRHRASENKKIRKELQRTKQKIRERSERDKRRRITGVNVDTSLMDSSESEDDQDLLDVKVAGSAYSTPPGTDALTGHACEPILQPPSTEGRESSNMNLGFGSLQVEDITEVMTECASKPILQTASTESHEPLENMTSSLRLQGVTELPIENACNSLLQKPEGEGSESTHDLVKRSPYFPGSENQKPTNNSRSSSQVNNPLLSTCNQPASGTSNVRGNILAPITNEVVEIPIAKKPTFSLRSLDKYLRM
ncbi:hypothetical protein M758_9G027500 [Ceratodon purpureus]|nr:hypothetical protein M758_9G027500 [Ceratodon purpureus]